MPKKRFSAEQIVTLLRQIEVSMGQGNSTQIACREAGISEQNYAMAEWRNLLQPERGTDCHRAMAQALQHDQAPLGPQLQATRTPDIRTLGSPPR
jgi:hypothetical protein